MMPSSRSLSPAHSLSSSSLMLPPSVENGSLDYDLWQRYSAVARILDRMLAGVTDAVHVLELGPNFLNPLPQFVDPARLVLTRADVDVGADPDLIVVDRDGPLPFADEAFDAVVAVEVLEHVPADRRAAFLRECLRVARHGAVITCPNGVPEVIEAEEVVAASYHRRHGHEHRYLLEHRQFGLPRVEDVTAVLRELDVPHAVFDNAPLDVWLAMIVTSENLSERRAPAELQRRFNDYFLRNGSGGPTPYRKIYVCAKSFDATAALEMPQTRPVAAAALPPASPVHHLAAAAAEVLGALEQDRRAERLAGQADRNLLEAEVEPLRTRLAALEAQLKESRARYRGLQGELATRSDELVTFRRRQYVLHAYLESLRRSLPWKLAALMRLPVRWLRTRGFDERALIPWDALERTPAPGEWCISGTRAHFIVPCHLPAGWLRIGLHLSSDQVGRAELSFDNCDTADDAVIVERVAVHGRADKDWFVYLPRPVVGFRFYPLDCGGSVRIEKLEVRALAPAAALVKAFRAKLGLLQRHGLLTRSLVNACGLLAHGRFREVGKKLHAALVYPQGRVAAEPAEAMAPQLTENPAATMAPAPIRIPPGGGGKLDVVYVLRSAGLCGGVKVVLEHTARLYARGHNVRVFFLEGELDWFPWRVPVYRFPDVASLRHALAQFRGIKVATWYETAPWVAESLRPGEHGYYLIQDIEESYCETPEQTACALGTYALGLRPITEGLWVRQQLKERFGLDSTFVSIGLDHTVFRSRLVLREPQRILTQARTWSGGVSAGARIKGWDVAREAVLRCHALNPRAALTTFSIEDKPSLPGKLIHDHAQSPSDETLAERYAQAGAYLLTSRHEGFGLTAAEAMACGCPVVATRAQGNEEFCIDGVTALTAPAGDAEALARHLLRLQSDPRLARRLAKTAQEFIRTYTWDRVIDRLEREFMGLTGPEVIIDPPREPAVVEVADSSASVDESTAPPQPAVPLPGVPESTCRRGGEYPDLLLRSSPSIDWSIVIPTVGKANLVAQCISSCRRFIRPETSAQFLVVDDGSSDGAVIEELRRSAKELDFQLLLNHQNLGFSATVNHGMRHARGRHVVLCNNDVIFFRPWLEPLEQLFASDPHLGIVGAKLLYPGGMIQHAGMDKMAGTLKWFHSHAKQPGDYPQASASRYLWSVTGALFAVRRQTLERLGGFSTAYATAYEDLDYCLYAWSNGVRVGYCAEAVAYHLEGGTRGATETEKRGRPLWAERERAGRAYFEKKWAFLRNVEDFRAVLALLDREGSEFPVFAEKVASVVA